LLLAPPLATSPPAVYGVVCGSEEVPADRAAGVAAVGSVSNLQLHQTHYLYPVGKRKQLVILRLEFGFEMKTKNTHHKLRLCIRPGTLFLLLTPPL